jgi:hypothetical protein
MGDQSIKDPSGNQAIFGTPQTSEKPKKTAVPDPAAAMLFFFIATSIYCLVGIFRGGGSTPSTKMIIKLCYILFVMTGEYFINLNLSNAMCGVNQWRSVLYITVVPWLLIFGVMHLFISIFPGWLSPFSNTFGYFVARLMGLPDLMKEIIVPVAQGETQRAILSVTADDSLLINQFTTETVVESVKDEKTGTRTKTRPIFDAAWDKLQTAKIIKTFPDPKENSSYRNKLYNFIEMKYTISEYVWNMLTGFLVTSVSYNYILNTGCEKSVEEMIKRREVYHADEKKKKDKAASLQSNQPDYSKM